MILVIHSDAGYCNEKKSRSQARGHFFLSNEDKFPPNNDATFTNATIIKAVMASAAKAELGALYLNAKEAVYLQQILIEMGHPQPQIPIQTDKTTAEGVTNKKKNQNAPKQWICNFIGSATASPKTNSKYIGDWGRQIWWIILQNTTLPTTTLKSEQNS
jgi:hypothetical protein